MKKVNFNELMEANINYLKELFVKDFYEEPTVEKKEIIEALNVSIKLMVEGDYIIHNIDVVNDALVIYIKDDKHFSYRIYNGVIDDNGHVLIKDTLTFNNDFIHNEDTAFDIDTITNILYLIMKSSYIVNTPFRYGLQKFEEIPGSNDKVEVFELGNTAVDMEEYNKGKEK